MKWLLGLIETLITTCIGEHYLIFRPNLSRDFLMKKDFNSFMSQLHDEHERLYKEITEIRKDIYKRTQ